MTIDYLKFLKESYLEGLYADLFATDQFQAELRRKAVIRKDHAQFLLDVNRSTFDIDGKLFRSGSEKIDGKMRLFLQYGDEVFYNPNNTSGSNENNEFGNQKFKEFLARMLSENGITGKKQIELIEHVTGHASQRGFAQIGEAASKAGINNQLVVVHDFDRVGTFSVENGKLKYTEQYTINAFKKPSPSGEYEEIREANDEPIATVKLESYIGYNNRQITHDFNDIAIRYHSSKADVLFNEEFYASGFCGNSIQVRFDHVNVNTFREIIRNTPQLKALYIKEMGIDENDDALQIQHSEQLSNKFYSHFKLVYEIAQNNITAEIDALASKHFDLKPSFDAIPEQQKGIVQYKEASKMLFDRNQSIKNSIEVAYLKEYQQSLSAKYSFDSIKSLLQQDLVKYTKKAPFKNNQRKQSLTSITKSLTEIEKRQDLSNVNKTKLLIGVIALVKDKVDIEQANFNKKSYRFPPRIFHKETSRLSKILDDIVKDPTHQEFDIDTCKKLAMKIFPQKAQELEELTENRITPDKPNQ